MKTRIIAFITTLFMAVACFSLSSSAQNNKKAALQEVTFVVNIDCANCVKKIEGNLPFEKGIKDMKVVLNDKTVWVKYSSKQTSKEKLASAIEKLGFQVLGVQDPAAK